jgi:hypothetical protein
MMAHRVNLLTILRHRGDTSMKSMVAQLTSIEGKASDVRQARTTIISNGGFGMAWDKSSGTSYECLFRISDAPVALRVSSPIFIEEGETVKVVGIQNLHGVFDAVAYCNRSSGASGKSESVWSREDHAMIYSISGAVFVFFVVSFAIWARSQGRQPNPDDALFMSIGVGLFVCLGLVLALYSLRLFMRYRRERHMIEGLLNDA